MFGKGGRPSQASQENISQPSCLVFLGLRGCACMSGEKGEDSCRTPTNGRAVWGGRPGSCWAAPLRPLPLALRGTLDKAPHRPGLDPEP